MDSEHFQGWVERHLCPALGRHSENDPNSIPIMGNASKSVSKRSSKIIESTVTCLILSSPYTSDSFPIECIVSICKTNLRRFSKYYSSDEWCLLLLKAVQSVSRGVAIKKIRRCEEPHANNALTEEEKSDRCDLFSSQLASIRRVSHKILLIIFN